MKKLLTVILVFSFAAASLLFGSAFWAERVLGAAPDARVFQLGNARLFLPMMVSHRAVSLFASVEEPPLCGWRPSTVDLVTGAGDTVVGSVTIRNDTENIYIEFTAASGQCLAATQAHVATSLEGIPMANGSPDLSQFEFQAQHSACIQSHTFVIPLQGMWQKAKQVVVVAHADVIDQQSGASQSAYGNCTPFPNDPLARYCTYDLPENKALDRLDISVGFEDLPLNDRTMDFDYNDWIADVDSELVYCNTVSAGYQLWRMEFNITPQARGAAYNHVFHLRFKPGTFPSDGTAILSVFDQDGNLVGAPLEQPFIAAQENDFAVIDPTSSAFPGSVINTIETRPRFAPARTATLVLEFDDPFFLDITPFDPALPGNVHGDNLLFDPYLFVMPSQGDTYEIAQGSERMLVVPGTAYLWPEERIPVWTAYPDVTPGDLTTDPLTPPVFPEGWWLNYNNCVYDGVPCQPSGANLMAPAVIVTPVASPAP